MKKSITLIAISVIIISVLTVCLCGCQKKEKLLETEYFKYEIYEPYSKGSEKVKIRGLTEKGRQQANIVIPEEIDGRRVVSYYGYEYDMPANSVKKIFVPYNIGDINLGSGILSADYKGYYKVLYISCTYTRLANWKGQGRYIATDASRRDGYKLCKTANIQYLLNYEYAQNKGVHFIDDLEIGEVIEVIPTQPKRDGYIFTGWYTEPECVNKIDLNSYEKADEEIIYFYAGWQEI